MTVLIIASIISLIVLIILITLYNIYVSLIKKKNKVQEAFTSIDVQLKKRYDLIPNILIIAKKFMEHEKNIFEEVTQMRSQALGLSDKFSNIDEKLRLNNEISQKMGQIIVTAENYPQLKSDQTMITAMQTYNEVEEHIAAARRFYNSAVNESKNAVEIFPSSLIAALLNIKATSFFEAQENERQVINANDYLN